jgi:N-acetylmuramoyl-L-alanine amidase
MPSPNHGERREDRRPDMLLLHYTGMPRTDEALAWLCDPGSSVSCHYFVFEDGRVVQLVPEARRAWHAGAASWGADRDINSCSIGVEIANPGHDGGLPAYPEAQIASVAALGRDIAARWSIPPERVLAHSDVAPGRKQDPGERFAWAELNGAGLGHWVQPAPVRGDRALRLGEQGAAVSALQALLACYGYGIAPSGVFDECTAAVVAAFQRHFRPARVDGIADESTLATLQALIDALPPSRLA